MLFSFIALSLVQVPERTYQPGLLDPGLHGGRIFDQDEFAGIFDTTTDVTPDGRVRIGFRQQLYKDNPDPQPDKYMWALSAGAVDTDRIQSDEHGDLSAFYDPTDVTPGDLEVGENFAFSSVTESNVIYWSPPFLGGDNEPGELQVIPDPCVVDTGLPLPIGGASNVTVAMQQLNPDDPERGENPYPSDASGVFDIDGTYRTYRLWAVLDHYGEPSEWECDGSGYLAYQHPLPFNPRLVALKLKVVVDVGGVLPTIHSAAVEQKPYQPLTFEHPLTFLETEVHGIEPSINADGTLIVYHGDGVNGTLQSDGNRLMYIWNPNGCSPTGWSEPRSVTDMPPPEFPGTDDEFEQLYGLAKYAIREPDNTPYAKGDLFDGAYPWVSKDGSFLVAMHINMAEGRRAGMFVVGDITGGYIKHIDDTALNPTRFGGGMDWPQTEEGSNFTLMDTGRTTLFSTGLKPGLWEPFLGAGVPVPTQRASERIPVLPIFVHRTRQYGEVRFEETDGNYLLYLACNESFELSEVPGVGAVMNARKTPDTAGRLLLDGTPAQRAVCSLDDGAAFPQEVVGTIATPDHDQVRQEIGTRLGENGEPLHENVGFKGQGIVMSTQGRITVQTASWGNYGTALTVQAFVKVVANEPIELGEWTLVEDPGRFRLMLGLNGSQNFLIGQVTVPGGGVKEVSGSWTAGLGTDIFDPREGWHHVAMVYNGNGTSRLFLYVDGVKVDTLQWGASSIGSASSQIFVGPGAGSPSAVNQSNMFVVLDEVAISRVARTQDEIMRDAYVTVEVVDEFEPLPIEIEVPGGLDHEQSHWPAGVAYSAAKVALGDALFDSTLLSSPLTYPQRSCATCHIPDDMTGTFLANAATRATAGQPPHPDLPFNVPTVLNMAFGTHKLFDGSASSVEDQITRPILGTEMGPQTMSSVLNRLKTDPGQEAQDLRQAFVDAYGSGLQHVTQANLKESLGMYLRTQLTGDSAFDLGTLSVDAQQGRALFFGKARCFGCHRGSNFSDDDFHNIGTVQSTEGITVRGGFTKRTTEDGQVKTPTLRNVAETGPWFHDGSVSIATGLAGVIEHYNEGFTTSGGIGTLDRQLRPLGLDGEEIDDLVEFLESLTGTVPE